MVKVFIVLGLLTAGAILWANYGNDAKSTTAKALRDTAKQVEPHR